MSTAIFDLDFHHLPSEIGGLDHYQGVLVLLRLYGVPVNQLTLPVRNGRIDGEELRAAVINSIDWNFWNQWLLHYLKMEKPLESNSIPTATVAICTRDRPDDLERCLGALRKLPDYGQEILVIDSCSSTNVTKQVVDNFEEVRYVREDYPGLNRARNRALKDARNEIVIFTDDDAEVDPGWLLAHIRNFDDPRVLCSTGLTMPQELETEAQEIFEQYSPFSRGFKRRIFHRNNLNPLTVTQVGAGVNMALRKEIFDFVGFFDEALDAGTHTHSGGESEMFSRILIAGYRIIYDPSALSWHRHRRTKEELQKALYGYGVGVYAFWARRLLYDGELSIPFIALGWFLHDQLPALIRSLLHMPHSLPLDLIMAELRGCLYGPIAYHQSRKQLIMRISSGS